MHYLDKHLRDRIDAKLRELQKLRPLPSSAVAKLKEQFAIEMTYNSNAIEGNKLTDEQIEQIAKKIQQECINKYGNNEKAAKTFWSRLVREVYEQNPEAVPVMIEAQPDKDNKQYMQGIYEELKCSAA